MEDSLLRGLALLLESDEIQDNALGKGALGCKNWNQFCECVKGELSTIPDFQLKLERTL
jgi:hypothetical protein